LTDTANEVLLKYGGFTVRIQKKYDAEFRQNAVDMLLTSGKTLKGLSRELGVSDVTLRIWKRAYVKEMEGLGDRSPGGVGGATPGDLVDEIRRLHKELDRMTRQRDILKKAMGILSEPSPGGMP
jgi:transposase-like protein